MIYFQPESRVASCKTADGALQLCRFLIQWFATDAEYGRSITFRAITETSGKTSVHVNYPVNATGMGLIQQAVAEFKAAHMKAAA
jgi:hypothetical protein